jgi:uncharacterized protein
MSLTAKIDSELKQSMLQRDHDKTSTLRMLKSAVKYAAIEKGGADFVPGDAEVVAVVRKEIKKRQDSIESYTKANRNDLADKEKKELAFLETYLPASLSPAEVEKIVADAIAAVGATTKSQMGAVMKAAQTIAAGRVDGKTLSSLVQKHLK